MKRYGKCVMCGAWRPKREMTLAMITAPLWPPGPETRHYECRTHTPRQKHRQREQMMAWLREDGQFLLSTGTPLAE